MGWDRAGTALVTDAGMLAEQGELDTGARSRGPLAAKAPTDHHIFTF
jgi:hypothetical protein